MEEKVMVSSDLRRKQQIRLLKDNNSVLILILILAAAFIFIPNYSKGFYNVINYVAMYGPVCLGLGLVMITGNIDLSVGFQAGSAGVVSVIVFNAVYNGSNAILALVLCILAALVCGAVTGFINGFVVAKIGVSPLIATIASNYAFQGFVFLFAQSSFQAEDTDTIRLIAKTQIGGMRWLTPTAIIFLVLVVLVFLWMYKTRFGNRLHVVGDNPEAASFAGISVPRTVWATYVLCGVLAAVTGFFMVSNAGYAVYNLLLRHRWY